MSYAIRGCITGSVVAMTSMHCHWSVGLGMFLLSLYCELLNYERNNR